MNRGTKLIMSRYLRLRILMLENRQQIDQGKTLRGSSCIRRFAIFIQSAFIADSDTMPVESTHMSTHLRDGTTMVKNSVTGNIKMVTDIKKAPLQMTFAKLFYTEANMRLCQNAGPTFFYAQSPDFPKPGLCYYPKFLYL